MGECADQTGETGARYRRWLPIIPAIAVILIFGCAVGHEFVDWDDHGYIVNNPYLNSFSLHNIRMLLTPGAIPGERLYIPLTYLSLFGGQSSAFIHGVNVLIHAANAVLVFQLIMSLHKKRLPAVIAALIFALHPLQVESVAWAMGRKDLLCALFMLAAMLLFTRWAVSKQWWWYVAVIGCFGLAILSKPVAVTLPILLALIVLYRGEARQKRLWYGLIPLVAIGLAAAILTTRVDSSPSLQLHLKLMFAAYLPATLNGWLARIFLLNPANPQYLVSSLDPSSIRVLYCMPLLLLIGALYISVRCGLRDMWFSILFAAVAAAPAAAILVFQSRQFYTADRYGYLALAGVATAIAVALHRSLWEGEGNSRKARRIAFGVFVGVEVLICSASSLSLTMAWRDTESLFTHASKLNADNHLAWTFLGTVAHERGDRELAVSQYRRAVQANVGHVTAWQNLSVAMATTNPVPESELASSRRMEAICRYGAPAHMAFLRGQRLEQTNQVKQALEAYEMAVARNHRHAQAQFRKGLILHRSGQLAAALAAYQSATAARPGMGSAWYNIGRIHMVEKRPTFARAAFDLAAKANPNDADTLIQLGQASLASGEWKAAIPPLKRAAQLSPKLGIVQEFLARAYLGIGDVESALRHADAAIALGHALPDDLQKRLAPHRETKLK